MFLSANHHNCLKTNFKRNSLKNDKAPWPNQESDCGLVDNQKTSNHPPSEQKDRLYMNEGLTFASQPDFLLYIYHSSCSRDVIENSQLLQVLQKSFYFCMVLEIMDPLIWSTGVRPNRPFRDPYYRRFNRVEINDRSLDEPQQHYAQAQHPSSYFVEQCYLARETSQAILHQEQQPLSETQDLLYRLRSYIFDLNLSILFAPWYVLREFVGCLRTMVCAAIISYIGWIPRSNPFRRLQWDIIFAGLLALQVARWLPEMKNDAARSTGRIACSTGQLRYEVEALIEHQARGV